ncbi:hypothetical protein F5Y12DRAFT_800388 [Xylaria sp. FL1777]|nr:hypothetical protein F5Y12DRAFT_800388 [Xylaria sp. FL1777]
MEALHLKPFAYKRSNDGHPSLQPHAYMARELINCTVGSFRDISDNDLTSQQRLAKRRFIRLFEHQLRRDTADLHKTNLYATLEELMRHLDEFFFFGSVRPLVRKFQLTHFPPGCPMLGNCVEVDHEDGPPRFDISLNNQIQGQLAGLSELVNTLLHEMTHVFLNTFVCRCSRCLRNDFNAVGVTTSGHGPTFRGLNYAAMVCLGGWNEDLDRVAKARSNNTYIDQVSLDLETRSREITMQNCAFDPTRVLSFVQHPSHNHLIWTH